MFLKGPFMPGIVSIEMPFLTEQGKPVFYYCGWPVYGPRIVAYDDGTYRVFLGGDYEQLWYRARCHFYKRNGEDIPS